MLKIYHLDNGRYKFLAGIYRDEGRVAGSSAEADFLRGVFEEFREYGFEPANHMDVIEAKIKEVYNNGYYLTP